MRVGRHVIKSLKNCQGKGGRRHLEREALADESSELRLMLERVDTGNDAARAVTEKKHRQGRFA